MRQTRLDTGGQKTQGIFWLGYRRVFSARVYWASQVAQVVKNLIANAGDLRDSDLIPGFGRSPAGGQPSLVFLPGESHGQRSLVGYSP